MTELELGEDRDGTVYNKSLKVKEKTTDILIAGGDPYFLRKKGMECDYQWMLEKPRKDLFRMLDSSKEYRQLAEILEIDAKELATIEKTCVDTKKSFTESVLDHWCNTTAQRMSLGRLHDMLKDHNAIGNTAAANVIEQMFKDVGHSVS